MEVKLNGDGVANGVEMEAAATDGDVYVCVNFVLFIQLFVQRWPRLSVSTFCINSVSYTHLTLPTNREV